MEKDTRESRLKDRNSSQKKTVKKNTAVKSNGTKKGVAATTKTGAGKKADSAKTRTAPKRSASKITGEKAGATNKKAVPKMDKAKRSPAKTTVKTTPGKKTVKTTANPGQRTQKEVQRNPYLAKKNQRVSRFDDFDFQALPKYLIPAILIIFLLYFIAFQLLGNSYIFGTTLNGVGLGAKSVSSSEKKSQKIIGDRHLVLTENGETVFDQPLSALGVSANEAELNQALTLVLQKKKAAPFDMLFGVKDFSAPITLVKEDALWNQVLTEDCLLTPRRAAVDAKIDYSPEGAVVTAEVPGTELNVEAFRSCLWDKISESLSGDFEGDMTIELPIEVYKLANILKEDVDRSYDEYAKLMEMTVTYTFGEETRVLDWSEISQMVYFDENRQMCLKDEPIAAIVASLALNYNTKYGGRDFKSHSGEIVHIERNGYGYEINQEAEVEQLKADLLGMESVVREPIYSCAGYQRNGNDDVMGTYIEVDISKQHIWCYYNYEVMISDDVVTGNPNQGNETIQGAFPVCFKASPFHLEGGGGTSDSWDVDVDYWIPFYDGYGIHDSTWRASYGGNIYLTKGSHGCVNVKLLTAAMIYEFAETGMPVFIYESAK